MVFPFDLLVSVYKYYYCDTDCRVVLRVKKALLIMMILISFNYVMF